MNKRQQPKQHSPSNTIIATKNINHNNSKEKLQQENQSVCIVKELGFRPKLLLYGDMVFDSDSLEYEQGQMFCENSQFQGIKKCTQITKTKDFFHFDVSNQATQIVDFSFLSQFLRDKELPFGSQLADYIQHYSARVKATYDLNSKLNATSRFEDLCLNNPLYSLSTVFQKTEEILSNQLKQTPLVHYQLFRKTGEFFSMIRGGLSLEGIRQFGVDIEAITQSMLRRSCLPIWRNDKGYILNMRSLQKLDIDVAQYAKKNIQLSQMSQIIIKNLEFTLHERTQVIALCPFIDEQSDCNYYLHLHTLQFIPVGDIKCITSEEIGVKSAMSIINSNSNNINNNDQQQSIINQNRNEVLSYSSGESSSKFEQYEQEEDIQVIPQEFQEKKQLEMLNYSVDNSAVCSGNNNNKQVLKSISKVSKSDSALSLSGSGNKKENISEWSSDNINNNDGISYASNERNEELHQDHNNNIISCQSPQIYSNYSNESKKDTLNYKRKVQEFISTYYENSGKEKQEKEQFDKVLKQMLTKKQKLLKVQLL